MVSLLVLLVVPARAQTVRFLPQMPVSAVTLSAPVPSLAGAKPLSSLLPGPSLVPVLKAPQATALTVAKMSERFGELAKAAPAVERLSPSEARGLGENSFSVLGGLPALAAPEPAQERYWGKAAGESIGEAAAAHFSQAEDEPSVPVMSAPAVSRPSPVLSWLKQTGAAISGFVSRRNPFRK